MHEGLIGMHATRRALGRWHLPDASLRRERTAVAVNLIPAVVAVAGFAILKPHSDWSDVVMIAALCGISAVAYLAEARLKFGVLAFYGATFIAAFVALIVAGALPALLVWIVPDVISRFLLRREPRLSPGLVATVSSYALAVLLGSELIAMAHEPTGTAAAPSLYAAGLAMWTVNFCFARLTFAPYYQGISPAALMRDEFGALAPTALGMLAVGVVAGLAASSFGVLALAPLALVVSVPQIVLERMVSSNPAHDLDRIAATRLYAEAIADVMCLPRAQRREIACATAFIDSESGEGQRGLEWRDTDVSRAAFLALHSHERWAGNGWPAGLPAEAIPIGSRILAVAVEWASLTARDTARLSQADAMLALEAQSGHAFDPAVVAAAVRVVADESGFAAEPSFQPKLHRLPGPRAWRRGALPGLLLGPAGS
jgi:HD domain